MKQKLLLLLGVLFSGVLCAQSTPGGVSNITGWFKADIGINSSTGVPTTNLTSATRWYDQSGNTAAFGGGIPARNPGGSKFILNGLNFNPVVSFSGDNSDFRTTAFSANLIRTERYFSGYAVFYANVDENDVVFDHGNSGNNNFLLGTRRIEFNGNYVGTAGSPGLGAVNGTYIVSGIRNGSTTSAYVNGSFYGSNSNDPRTNPNDTFAIGANNEGSNDFSGNIAEVILVNKAHNSTERQKVESYLGIKYGLTLPFDYTASNETVFWDRTVNSSFNKNIAGIGRDDGSDLKQKQSKSINSGSAITMGLNEIANTNAENSYSFSADKTFITWGSNGATGTTDTSPGTVCGSTTSRMNRVWLVQTTGNAETVEIEVDFSQIPYNTTDNVSFLVGTDENMNSYDAVYQVVKGKVKYTFPANSNTYFTFAGKAGTATCNACDASGRKTLSWGNWTRGDNGPSNLGNAFGEPTIVQFTADSGVQEYNPNRYPRIRRGRLLHLAVKDASVEGKYTSNFAFGLAKKVSFRLHDIDVENGTTIDEVSVYGTCDGNTIYPRLSYIRSNSSYTISGSVATGNRRIRGIFKEISAMDVVFDEAVEEVYVEWKAKDSRFRYQRLGISNLTLSCPQAIPPTLDNITLIKDVDNRNPFTCEEVTYSFEITNSNCNDKTINFDDVLPSGMLWKVEGLSEVDLLAAGATINTYEDTNTLDIDGITVPAQSTFYFKATAYFEDTATAGTYGNQANFTLTDNLNNYNSYDANDLTTPNPTNLIAQVATTPYVPTATMSLSSADCYLENNVRKVTVDFNNTSGTAVSNIELFLKLDGNATIVDGTLVNPNGGTIFPATYGGEQTIEIIGLTIPVGTSQLTFDVNVNNSVGDLIFTGDISLDGGSNPCWDTEESVGGEINFVMIPVCTVCYKDGDTTGTAVNSKIGITTLRRSKDSNWVITDKKNGFLVLESKTKGLVLTRMADPETSITDEKEGMVVFDTDDKCLKLYDGTKWTCITQTCNE